MRFEANLFKLAGRGVLVGLLLGLGGAGLVAACAADVQDTGGDEDDDDGEGGQGGEGGAGGGADAGPDGDAGPDVPPIDASIPCTGPEDCAIFEGVCATATCANGFCAVTPINELGACDDGLFCSENDTCIGGACVGGTSKFCPSQDSCHLGVCDEDLDTCKNIAGNDGGQCDDMDPCTGAGVCNGGVCSKGSQINCSVFNSGCTTGVCDPAVGCKAMPLADGTACNDGQGTICSSGQCQAGICVGQPQNEGQMCFEVPFSPCSDSGLCTAGSCVPIPKNDGDFCDDQDFDPCTEGTCQLGVCVNGLAPNGTACDDYQFCTQNESCQNGVCAGGQPTICAPPGGCWIASCDENFDICSAVPGNDGQPCDDSSACTDGTTCLAGACVGGMPTNDGQSCDDGKSCTTGDVCSMGTCSGTMGPVIYFSEDFSDNLAGWTLGPEWEIGPAQPSAGGVFGADPAVDHTPTGDNGVAGVVIGGNASTNLHPYYYLESPAFNTQAAPGSVIFGFYRWLNSDYDPYMHNQVEVFNGAQWIVLWNSGPPPGVQDSPPVGSGWTYIQYDVTAHKNANMRVRFGFDITSGGVFTIGSWNVDDVVVAAQACP